MTGPRLASPAARVKGSGSRLRQFGWAVAMGICLTAFVALAFRVNAVKSEVKLAEREIIALERATTILETEFAARASQQQLADWNKLEFGYRAPDAQQFLENERQLVSLGTPRGIDAPAPIRVARAPIEAEEDGLFPTMVSPLTGRPFGDDVSETSPSAIAASDAGAGNAEAGETAEARPLAERLAFTEAFASPEALSQDLSGSDDGAAGSGEGEAP